MEARDWKKLIRTIPRRSTYEEAAALLGQSYHMTRYWMIRFGKKARRKNNGLRPETRRLCKKADWSKSNIVIAAEFGVTRERIRQIRERIGKPKVEARGRRKLIAA